MKWIIVSIICIVITYIWSRYYQWMVFGSFFNSNSILTTIDKVVNLYEQTNNKEVIGIDSGIESSADCYIFTFKKNVIKIAGNGRLIYLNLSFPDYLKYTKFLGNEIKNISKEKEDSLRRELDEIIEDITKEVGD